MKKSRELERNSVGFEIKKSLLPIIKKKTLFDEAQGSLLRNNNDTFEVTIRKQGRYGPIG